MKTKKKAETVEVEVLEPDEVNFGEVLVVRGDAAERIRRHILAANALGRMSLAHGVVAGWELARQKAQIGWGGWRAWCQTSLGFSTKTADNYIALCMRTLGAAREAARIPLESAIREDEIEAATAEVADKTATAAMIAFGIVKRNPEHGGAREGAGRKAAAPDPREDAAKTWTLALVRFRDMPDTSYRFVPLNVAEGVIAELGAVCEKLKARVAELRSASE